MKKLGPYLLALFASFSFAAGSPPQKLTLILDGSPSPDQAPVIIAKQQGFFKEQGLYVKLITPNSPSDPLQRITDNKADIAITTEPKLIEQIESGLPFIRIGTLIDKPLNCLVTLKETGIKSLADLKNKQIAMAQNDLSNIILETMLKDQGITPKDFHQIHFTDATQALLEHKVDAAMGMKRNFEVPMLELQDRKVMAFFPEEHGIPTYDELVFVSTLKNTHDPRFPRFLLAIKKAVRYLDENSSQSWKVFANKYPQLNTAINRDAWFASIPYFAEDPAYFKAAEWERFAQFLHQHNLIKKDSSANHYAIVLDERG